MNDETKQSIVIKKLTSRAELKEWILFPIKLLSEYPAYVPPLVRQEIMYWDPRHNPVLKSCEYIQLSAYRNNIMVGRIAGLINPKDFTQKKEARCRWGWVDFIDDFQVAHALLHEVETWAAGQNICMDYLEGPLGFTNLDKAGLLIKGYHELDNITTWFHPPYYRNHIEQCGYQAHAAYREYLIQVPQEIPQRLFQFNQRISDRLKLKSIHEKTPKKIVSYARELFKLMNSTHGHLHGYTAITDHLIDHYANRYARFIQPDFTSIIVDEEGKLVAFGIALPNLSRAFQKTKGNIWPLGWFYIRRALRKNTRADLLLIGVHPDLQSKGVPAMIFLEIMQGLKKYGIKEVETNPELESNQNVQRLWSKYDARQHKSRMTFMKRLTGR